MKPLPKPILLNIETAAREFCVDAETLRRGMLAIGIETKKGDTHNLATIWRALSGDVKAATARERLATAIAKERDNRIADGELIPFEEYAKFCRESHGTNRQRWLALPSVMAQRCNPSDPKFAQDALQQFTDESLAMVDKALAALKQ